MLIFLIEMILIESKVNIVDTLTPTFHMENCNYKKILIILK